MLLLLAGLAHADGEFDGAFERAEAQTGAPAELLAALAWEASRMNPSAATAWGGYGLYDFREDDESHGPGIERVSILLGESPDGVMDSAELQILGAAALLVWHAEQMDLDTSTLEGWAPAVAAFSGRMEPNLQALFVEYIYEVVATGVYDAHLHLHPQDVDVRDALSGFDAAWAPPADTDYAGAVTFTSAHSSNYSNYSRGPGDINYVVIHTVQGSYSGCISWFQNSSANVSAHYVVRSSDGQVTQMVREEDVGWHAGNWTYNEQSVGIEHEGYVDEPSTWYTSAMYAGSAALTADIVSRNSISLDRSHIIAHYEVPGATHTDPGAGWDWSRYMDLIGGDTGPAAEAEFLGVVADGDIYSGERLSGVRVELLETGDVTTTDADGWYRFPDLPAGTYTASASAEGYKTGTCSKQVETGTGQWWCSMALEPGDPDPVDTGEPQDSDEPLDTDLPSEAPGPFAERAPLTELGGCTHAPLAGFWMLALAALGLRRR